MKKLLIPVLCLLLLAGCAKEEPCPWFSDDLKDAAPIQFSAEIKDGGLTWVNYYVPGDGSPVRWNYHPDEGLRTLDYDTGGQSNATDTKLTLGQFPAIVQDLTGWQNEAGDYDLFFLPPRGDLTVYGAEAKKGPRWVYSLGKRTLAPLEAEYSGSTDYGLMGVYRYDTQSNTYVYLDD